MQHGFIACGTYRIKGNIAVENNTVIEKPKPSRKKKTEE
jgi:hypothetical protein